MCARVGCCAGSTRWGRGARAHHVGDVAAGVGHRDALATEVDHLLAGVSCDVAGAGEHDVLALEVRAW